MPTSPLPRPSTGAARRARLFMGVSRQLVGVGSWASPGASWRTFGLGPLHGDPSAALITRLFGVRDLALGAAVVGADPALRRHALRIGLLIDGADVISSLRADRAGAPRTALLGVGAGAALFVVLGAVALAGEDPEGTA